MRYLRAPRKSNVSTYIRQGVPPRLLAVVRSMTSTVNEHAQGNYLIHTGFPFMGHPSVGAWTTYGLGSENQELPGFVAMSPRFDSTTRA